MRVLYISGPCAGGIRQHMAQLRQGLFARGIDVVVSPSVRVNPQGVSEIYLKLRRGQFDLAHCHGFQGALVGRAAATLARVPALVTLHNAVQVKGIEGQGLRLAEAALSRRTRGFIAVSAWLKNYAIQWLGLKEEAIEVITNGLDLPPELPPWHEKPVVGIVARLVPGKGVDIFLRSLAHLRLLVPGIRGVVLGDGPQRLRLESLAHHLGLGASVRFYGHCSDVPQRLKQMAVFVLPTRSEGLGVSIMEAMAAGTPVVASRVGGVPELVIQGQTGILVSPDDPQAIVEGVLKILDDAEFRDKIRQGAFTHLAENFAGVRMIESTYNTYQRVTHA